MAPPQIGVYAPAKNTASTARCTAGANRHVWGIEAWRKMERGYLIAADMALSPQEREEARNEYFNHVVARTLLIRRNFAEVRRAFDTDTAPKQQQQGRASGGPVITAIPVDEAAIARQV
ncbi:hypothetical protein [Xylella fastidiosa]|uniref:hypothetical protein n=1 Tax=Xylella fastidiosa TaxID=2371 RepID=UPI0039847A9F